MGVMNRAGFLRRAAALLVAPSAARLMAYPPALPGTDMEPGTVIHLSNAGYFDVGEVVTDLSVSGEKLLITGISGNTITVTRGIAGGLVAA